MQRFETLQVILNGTKVEYTVEEFAAILVKSSTSISHGNSVHAIWFLICGVLILLLQAGQVLLEIGGIHTRQKEAIVGKSLMECCVIGIGFYLAGFASTFVDGDSVYGYGSGYALSGSYSVNPYERKDIDNQVFIGYFWFIQYGLACVAASIMAKSISGRLRMEVHVLYVVAFVLVIYPAVAHVGWSMNGFASPFNEVYRLFRVGVIDVGGSTILHVSGGVAALIANRLLGPEEGRFDIYGEAIDGECFTENQQRNLALHSFGTLLSWMGFYGIAGAVHLRINSFTLEIMASSMINMTISAAMGGLGALFWCKLSTCHRDKQRGTLSRFTAHQLATANGGILAGLVAISAGCATMDAHYALIVGLIASFIYFKASDVLLDHEIDDRGDAIPVHLLNGIWGTIAAALFTNPTKYAQLFGAFSKTQSCGLVYWCDGIGANQLAANTLFILMVMLWVGFISALLLIPFSVYGILHQKTMKNTLPVEKPMPGTIFHLGRTYDHGSVSTRDSMLNDSYEQML